MRPKVVFMGSPGFSLPTLKSLAENTRLMGVVTQPDRPSGRGQNLTPPPVKTLAEELGVDLIHPRRLKDPGVFEQLQTWNPDVIVVAAFGQILRQNVLELPRYGCINVHASLLPRWRGAAPVQASIYHGDEQTGITIMRMDAGIDTGAILTRRETPILPDDTAGSLTARLGSLGADLLMETLPGYLAGDIIPIPQDEHLATYAPMLKKEEGRLEFTERSAGELARQVRAFFPWPGAYLVWQGQPLKVLNAEAIPEAGSTPGTTCVHQRFPAVAAREGLLLLREVQPPGKKPMSGKVFLNGAREWGQ